MASKQSEREDATVKHGVDTEEFASFIDWLEENPENGYLTLRSEWFYDGVVGHSTVHTAPSDPRRRTRTRGTRAHPRRTDSPVL